jgi:hypothetical protein
MPTFPGPGPTLEGGVLRYAGIDPGANFTGVAIHNGDRFIAHGEFDDPVDAMWFIDRNCPNSRDLVTIVEAFTGTGRLNKRRIRTIEIVGYCYNRCRERGITVVRQRSDVRLPCVSLVPPEISGKDEKAAAAHVLAHLERRGSRV